MILAIDVGNTHIVLGCIENGSILSTDRLRTEKNMTDTEFAIKLKDDMQYRGIDEKNIEGSILASVVPETVSSIKRAVKAVTGTDCMTVGAGIKTGMNVRIDDPGTLAGDIVAGSVGAMKYYGTPVIVLDMGTATTIVVINGKNEYLGGAIVPGVNLGLHALAGGTSLLPAISLSAPSKCIATNTVDSMRSGSVYGTAFLIDGMIEKMEEELGEKCSVVATGGLASSIIPYCKRKDISVDGELLLKGLWVLYEKNRKKE